MERDGTRKDRGKTENEKRKKNVPAWKGVVKCGRESAKVQKCKGTKQEEGKNDGVEETRAEAAKTELHLELWTTTPGSPWGAAIGVGKGRRSRRTSRPTYWVVASRNGEIGGT